MFTLSIGDTAHATLGVASSYHVRTNVSVRRDKIWGSSVHGIHKGKVLIFSSMYI